MDLSDERMNAANEGVYRKIELVMDEAISDAHSVVEKLKARMQQGAFLRGANLQDTDLYEAELQGANLQGADLQGADLGRAFLQGASLEGADLRGAYLLDTDLRGAELENAKIEVPKKYVGKAFAREELETFLTSKEQQDVIELGEGLVTVKITKPQDEWVLEKV